MAFPMNMKKEMSRKFTFVKPAMKGVRVLAMGINLEMRKALLPLWVKK